MLFRSLNAGSLDLTVIGSPGEPGEEQITQSLGGATEYSLNWDSTHETFRLKIDYTLPDVTQTPPSVDSLSLRALSGTGQDQNPETTWEIRGALYDQSGNEYEGGGVISRYGG